MTIPQSEKWPIRPSFAITCLVLSLLLSPTLAQDRDSKFFNFLLINFKVNKF